MKEKKNENNLKNTQINNKITRYISIYICL